ncbi:hypothetical protein B0H34DRAFT_843241 [Crassisporium funariophilum]|nr:hypothetical protein B0H34DRAFT_843241 [Crassisporium funariophilum]
MAQAGMCLQWGGGGAIEVEDSKDVAILSDGEGPGSDGVDDGVKEVLKGLGGIKDLGQEYLEVPVVIYPMAYSSGNNGCIISCGTQWKAREKHDEGGGLTLLGWCDNMGLKAPTTRLGQLKFELRRWRTNTTLLEAWQGTSVQRGIGGRGGWLRGQGCVEPEGRFLNVYIHVGGWQAKGACKIWQWRGEKLGCRVPGRWAGVSPSTSGVVASVGMRTGQWCLVWCRNAVWGGSGRGASKWAALALHAALVLIFGVVWRLQLWKVVVSVWLAKKTVVITLVLACFVGPCTESLDPLHGLGRGVGVGKG